MRNEKLIDFYLKEYEVLSQAHFQASQRITTFFQYALIILAAPIAVFELVTNLFPQNNSSSTFFDQPLAICICIGIGLVGLFIVLYLGQLRSEVLMYARSVNTIRKFFYDNQDLGKDRNLLSDDYFVLLHQQKKPRYWDGEQFVFIIFALGAMNTLYFGFAMYQIGLLNAYLLTTCGVFYALHFGLYYFLTCLSESNCRFFKHKIGIDIDGVITDHEKTFVEVYNQLINGSGMTISQDDITTIPVHESGIINEADEQKVFRNTDYWEKLTPICNAIQIINEKLRNTHGYKIYLFTWRDWKLEDSQNLKRITKKWLKKNEIKCKKLFFESGNFDHPINARKALYKNRYYYSQKYKIEFFIEDEPIKAIKLSKICRYVFLIAHKYNESSGKLPYPKNVIRVKDWDELYMKLKSIL